MIKAATILPKKHILFPSFISSFDFVCVCMCKRFTIIYTHDDRLFHNDCYLKNLSELYISQRQPYLIVCSRQNGKNI